MSSSHSKIFLGGAIGSLCLLLFVGWFVIQKKTEELSQEKISSPTGSLEETNTAPAESAKENSGETPVAVSSPAISSLFNKKFDGRDLTVGEVLDTNASYTRYYITYKSGELSISGIMNVPKGDVPNGGFPVLILNHGHIDTSIYTNGRGLKREQDYLARQGFVVIHPDYRNHAESSKTDDDPVEERIGYVEDVINLVYAVKASNLSYLHKENIGMMGHSMGGGISQTVAVVAPDLVKAMVLYAPVSMDLRDSFERWMSKRKEDADEIGARYGTPKENPEFWDSVSTETYSDRISVPFSYHHGTNDADVPIEWTEQSVALLQSKNKTVESFVYDGEGHEFGPQWTLFMQRTAAFFRQHLDGSGG